MKGDIARVGLHIVLTVRKAHVLCVLLKLTAIIAKHIATETPVRSAGNECIVISVGKQYVRSVMKFANTAIEEAVTIALT